MKTLFRSFAHRAADLMGSPGAFLAAVAMVLLWLGSGPAFRYSDTWQLFINTGTTVLTFLAVFLLQTTQNRDTMAIQLKLDELLRALKTARNELVQLEDLSDEDLQRLREEFTQVANRKTTDD